MTPAIRFLDNRKISYTTHNYDVPDATANYGQHAADALAVPYQQLFKTLVVKLNNDTKKLAVCIIPVDRNLNLKLAAACFGVKKISMAGPTVAEQATGYVIGGISPFGQKKSLPIVLDASANALHSLYCSGGKRGLQLQLSPKDLLLALNAKSAELTSPDM